MQKKSTSTIVLLLFMGLLLAALPLVAACATGETPAPTPAAPTEGTIRISFSNDLTGPLSTTHRHMFKAECDYVSMLNEEGGINGNRIEYIWVDSGYNPARVQSNWKRIEAYDPVVHFTCGTVENEALKDDFIKTETPCFGPAITTPMLKPEPGWYYLSTGNYVEWINTVMLWAKDDWAKRGETEPLQFVAIGYKIGAAMPGFEAGPALAEELGMDWLEWEFTGFRALDYKAQLDRVSKAGADYVYAFLQAGDQAVLYKDAAAMGLSDKMKFCCVITEDTAIKVAKEAAEGTYALCQTAWFTETNLPGVKRVIDTQMKYHGDVSQDVMYMWGWDNVHVAAEGIRLALEDVGIEGLDGAAVKAGLHKIENFDCGGLIPPVTLTNPNEREGCWSAKIATVENGKYVPATDWITPTHRIIYEGELVPLP